MTPEIIRYNIPENQAAAFLQAYRAATAVLQQSPHCLGVELLHSCKDPTRYLLTIDWDSSEGHLQGFRQSALFPEFFALIRPFFECILEMEHYAATDVRWQRHKE